MSLSVSLLLQQHLFKLATLCSITAAQMVYSTVHFMNWLNLKVMMGVPLHETFISLSCCARGAWSPFLPLYELESQTCSKDKQL